MKIIRQARGMKQSTANFLASGFSLMSGLLWLLTAVVGHGNALMWIGLAALFLVQAGFWFAVGSKARKQGR